MVDVFSRSMLLGENGKACLATLLLLCLVDFPTLSLVLHRMSLTYCSVVSLRLGAVLKCVF